MKVKELIELLETKNPDLEVVITKRKLFFNETEKDKEPVKDAYEIDWVDENGETEAIHII